MKHWADSVTAAGVVLTLILGGYAYVLTVSFKTDANAKDVAELRQKQSQIDLMQTDLAVIKEQVLEIRKRMDERHK